MWPSVSEISAEDSVKYASRITFMNGLDFLPRQIELAKQLLDAQKER
jgi:hypothetical protein